MSSFKKSGFTLIELLVVIAIIGLLASIVLVSLNSARAKARDTRRIADMKQISIALQMYFDKTGSMPINRNPGVSYNDSQVDFLKELIDSGFLSVAPKDSQSPTRLYFYYDYGAGSTRGAMVTAKLETIKNHPSSCVVDDYLFRVCNRY